MTKFKIHPSVLLVVVFICFGVLTWWQTLLLWGSAIFHEAGHIFAYRIHGISMAKITLLPFGICAEPKNPLEISPKNEIFCAASGPILNFFVTALLLALPIPPEIEAVRYLLYCNGALFSINILPILPLDGGRILYYALAEKQDAVICEIVCRRVGWIILILLLYPVCASLFADKNPSLAMIWGYLAVYSLLRRGSI